MKSLLFLIVYLFSLVPANVYAAGTAAKGGSNFSPVVGLLLMFVVFFFLIIWPQSRRAKKQAQFIASLKKGDDVVTTSGLHGKIYGISDQVITLELAPNMRVRVDRQNIARLEGAKADKVAQMAG